MATAADRVLGVYELLEHIIVSMDLPRDIFNLKRVNKTWRDVITRSQDIRQLCFLEPNGEPIQPRDRPQHFKTTSADRRIVYPETAFKTNSLLVSRRDMTKYRDGGSIDFITFFKPPKRDATRAGMGSSHRELYLTQPPCTAVFVEVKDISDDGCLLIGGEVYRNAAGVRMGEIEDWVVGSGLFRAKSDASSIRFTKVRITEHRPRSPW